MGVIALAALLSAPALAQSPSASDLAARIQAHLSATRNFTAAFTVTETSPLMPKAATDHGTVEIQKPGRMRWQWTTGNKELVVSDGTDLYAYFPNDKYVRRSSLSGQTSTAFLFLAGRGDLTRDFIPSAPAAQPADEWHLDVKPKASQADFTALTIAVDRASYALRGLVVTDNQGGTSTYRFSDMRENQSIPDRDFLFAPPPNVEILQ